MSSSRVPDYPEFLHRYYRESVLELGRDYPDRKTLVIDYLNLCKFDNEAGKWLLDNPDRELKALKKALIEQDMPESDAGIMPDGNMKDAEIAVRGLLDQIPIHKVGRDQVEKLISVEGRITRIAPKYQKLTRAAFICQRCGDVTSIPQPLDKFMEPFECQNDSCGRRGPFVLVPEESDYEDRQKIAIQDLYESAKPGQPLREVIVVLRNEDLITSLPGMGAQCTITGIVRLHQKPLTSIYNTFIEAVHIEPKETEIDLYISEAEKKEFEELAASSDIMLALVDSTAPEILGYYIIKLALLCATVSGSDNPHFREYIHVILCGDPGTGKSALLRSVRSLVPRAQYSAGKGSSVAGLTVAVVKDELSGSGYTAQAGALVLADRGLMVLDEADKLEKEDFQALNTALEDGFIEVHKGGINQKFNTRCSVIALCNPKNIRFDDYEPLTKQIAIPPDTLSRFDLIFKIQDKPDPGRDKAIALHQAQQWARYEGSGQDQPDVVLSQEKLIKFLQYAKTFTPRTNPEIRETIVNYFLTLRKIDETGTIAATARQNSGIYRLTKSIARLRLSDTCNKDDVEKAIEIHRASLEAFRDPKTGKIDADIVLGSSKSQRETAQAIKGIIKTLQGSNGDKAEYHEIITEALTKGIKEAKVSEYMKELKNQGDILEVSAGYYRVI